MYNICEEQVCGAGEPLAGIAEEPVVCCKVN